MRLAVFKEEQGQIGNIAMPAVLNPRVVSDAFATMTEVQECSVIRDFEGDSSKAVLLD